MRHIGHRPQLQLSLLALHRTRSQLRIARMLWEPSGKKKSKQFWTKCDWMLLRFHFPGCSQCSQLGTAELELVPIHTKKHSGQPLQLLV
jgi:hypothetical protein